MSDTEDDYMSEAILNGFTENIEGKLDENYNNVF